MTTDVVERWVKGEEAATSSQDVEKILSFYTDDCVYEDVAVGKVSRGKEEIRGFFKEVFVAFRTSRSRPSLSSPPAIASASKPS